MRLPWLTTRRGMIVILAQKYRYAARYPWRPVAPDPPELGAPE
jgi:hypothetical protein